MMIRLDAPDVAATHAVAARLAGLLRPGDVVGLQGDLGSGKTTFVQGLARALGVPGPISSPTFTLLHEHAGGRLLLFHGDAYRLAGPADLADLGWDDILRAGGVAMIEWADRIAAALPGERLDIMLAEAEDGGRRITLTGRGARWARLETEWESAEPC